MPKNPDGTYTITNPSTGEKKVVQPSELSQYGLSDPQASSVPQSTSPAMVPNMSGVKVDTIPQGMQYPSTFGPSFLDGAVNTAKNVGAGIANGPLRFGKALGNLVATLDPTIQKSQQDTQQTYRDTADRLSTQAMTKAKAGDVKAANALYSLAQESLAKAGSDSADISNAADVGTEDLIKGGVGTAALFAPTVGGFLPQIGVGAAAGAASGFGASQRGNELGDTLKGAAIGGTVAGALNVAGDIKNAISQGGSKLAAEGEGVTQGVRQIRVKPSVGGAQEEQAINQTLDDLGIKGSPQQQYEQLQPAMTKIEGQIRPILEQNPTTFTPEQVKHDIVQELWDQGLLVGEKSKVKAAESLDNVMGDVINKNAKGELTGTDIFDVKQRLNTISKRLTDKLDRGIQLTPDEEVLLASRDALDKKIAEYYPEVKDLTLQQSKLFDAAPSISRARSNPPTLRVFGNSIPARASIAGQQIAGNTLQGAGNLMQKAGSLPSIPAGVSPLLSATLPSTASVVQNGQQPQPTMNGTNSQENLNNVPEQGSPFGTTGNPTPSPQALPPITTLTGHTPEENYAAYQKAQAAGNTEAAAQLYKRYTDEAAYQKTNNPAAKPMSSQTAKDHALAASGMRGVDEVNRMLKEDPSLLEKSFLTQNLATRSYENAAMRAAEGILRLRTGAVVSPNEAKAYAQKYLPWFGDDAATVKYKLEGAQADYNDLLSIYKSQDAAPDTSQYLPQIQ